MKTRVIRSEEKIEEEKIKMFRPRTLNKEEQLRVVFSYLFASMITEYIMLVVDEPDKLIEKYTNIFMKEIKIRVKLQGVNMSRTIYRVRKNTEKKELILTFGEKENAKKISKRLDFKTFIEEVILDDEGKVIQIKKI